ncbi:MAG: hypothetical protein JSU68_07620 [Phycisphaerales bacterium]|nr:MAG: hypothetical protein JSU68_07620 [Phycisphaerales bacterium]
MAVLHELRFPAEQSTVRLDLQYGQTKFDHGAGAAFVVHEPRGDLAFERDLGMEMVEPSSITASLEAFLVERGCTLANRERIERATGDGRITADLGREIAADFGRKLEADVLLVYAALGGNHAYYASKDRAWTYFLDPEIQIDGRFIAIPDGRALGTFQLRTSLAAEQGVERLSLYGTGDKGIEIKEQGKRREAIDPRQAAADALHTELAKHWPK